MGSTNLRESLGRAMGHWAAELQDSNKEIAKIQSLFEKLPGLQVRADHLAHVLAAAGVVMKEINPDWNDSQLKLRRKNVYKGSGRPGDTAQLTLDVLRNSEESLTARQIAIKTLWLAGNEAPEREDIRRETNNVDAVLRQKRKDGIVDCSEGYNRKWRVVV